MMRITHPQPEMIVTTSNQSLKSVQNNRGKNIEPGKDVWAFGSRDILMRGTILSVNGVRAKVLIGENTWSFHKDELSLRTENETS